MENKLEDIAITDSEKQIHYNKLFSTKTPVEIIENLVYKYWSGNWEYIEVAYRKNTNKIII